MSIKNPSLFSIVGTTSVGKSDAALDLANYLIENKYCSGVSIISADSRQIYQGLEILSGADIPDGFERTHDPVVSNLDFLQKDTIKIFGLSSIKVTEDWSVSQFREFSRKIISLAFSREELILVVGGTGLYHNYILNTDPHLDVPPNFAVREKAESLAIVELQTWLEKVNPEKLAQMNNSDKNNSRRLVRAIEIALAQTLAEKTNRISSSSTKTPSLVDDPLQNTHHYFFGLQITSEELKKNIAFRVEKRFRGGAVDEVKKILKNQVMNPSTISPQVTSTLGFAELQSYLKGNQTEEACKTLWIQSETQYSKRQLTWWKKQEAIEWFDKNEADWFLEMTETIKKLLTDN